MGGSYEGYFVAFPIPESDGERGESESEEKIAEADEFDFLRLQYMPDSSQTNRAAGPLLEAC